MPTKNRTFDFALILIPLIFLVVSVAVIYGLMVISVGASPAIKQGVVGLVGIGLFFLISFLDYRFFRGTAWIFWLVSLVLLVLVLLFGKVVNGAGNWLDLKVFQLQPSELAKIFVIFLLAALFSNKVGKLRFADIIVSLFILVIPLALIGAEPDFGSALVIVFIYAVMLWVAKPSRLQTVVFATGLIAILVAGFLSYKNVSVFGHLLKDYQRQRIAVFLDPSKDPLGRGYNVNQAQITIGSGGLLGRGLGKGSQSQLQFLPEAHTDFIFAGISESFGFLGALTILVLYCYLIIHLFSIAQMARDNFGMIAILGIAAMFFFQVLENVGMNLGLLPVTGIPLPFLSSGGTSLLVSLFALGFAESVYIRHKKITF